MERKEGIRIMASWYDDISPAWKNDIDFLRTIHELSGLPIALWMSGNPSAASWTSCPDSAHPCLTDEALRRQIEGSCSQKGTGLLLSEDWFYYGVAPIGTFSLAIGPAILWSLSEEQLQPIRESCGLDADFPIKKVEPTVMKRYLRLIHIHFLGTALSDEEIAFWDNALEGWHTVGALEEYQLDQSENEREHQIGMEFENALLQAVKDGDPDRLNTLLTGPTPDFREIGEFSDDQKKEIEYLVVSVITLLTRAAIAGGVQTELAYQFGDVFLKRLSKAVQKGEPVLGLSHCAMLEFTELVRRAKEEKSSLTYVDACKAYIEKNLRKNLQVGEIAPAIGVSRTYLSRLFRQAEGITVQQYIQKEKCRHAAQMLRYSDYPISQIAQYYGFSTQSYFGACFQTWFGMTPNAYRKANH